MREEFLRGLSAPLAGFLTGLSTPVRGHVDDEGFAGVSKGKPAGAQGRHPQRRGGQEMPQMLYPSRDEHERLTEIELLYLGLLSNFERLKDDTAELSRRFAGFELQRVIEERAA